MFLSFPIIVADFSEIDDFSFVYVCCWFDRGSLYIYLAVLELIMHPRLTLNFQSFTNLCLPGTEIKNEYHYA